jgi:hypothetical protein
MPQLSSETDVLLFSQLSLSRKVNRRKLDLRNSGWETLKLVAHFEQGFRAGHAAAEATHRAAPDRVLLNVGALSGCISGAVRAEEAQGCCVARAANTGGEREP